MKYLILDDYVSVAPANDADNNTDTIELNESQVAVKNQALNNGLYLKADLSGFDKEEIALPKIISAMETSAYYKRKNDIAKNNELSQDYDFTSDLSNATELGFVNLFTKDGLSLEKGDKPNGDKKWYSNDSDKIKHDGDPEMTLYEALSQGFKQG